jgi:hypothetical protein
MLTPGERLVREILHTDSLGTDLLIEYIKKFAMSDKLVGEREGAGMSKREHTVDAAKNEGKHLVGLATAVTKSKLDEGTIPELLQEIEALNTHVMEGFPDVSKLSRERKENIQNALIEVRKKAFSAKRALSDQFAKATLTKAYGGKRTPENRGAELQQKFWSTEFDGNASLTNYRVDLTEE